MTDQLKPGRLYRVEEVEQILAADAQAEIKRLRDCLDAIQTELQFIKDDTMNDPKTLRRCLEAMQNYARVALGEKP